MTSPPQTATVGRAKLDRKAASMEASWNATRSRMSASGRSSKRKASPTTSTPSPVTTEQTLEYQNREMVKTLLVLETHLAQKCRIAGQPCDCCSPKHPLELQKLAEEAVTMSEEPVYRHVHGLAGEIMDMANVDVLMTGATDAELPKLARRTRDLRKSVMKLLPKAKEKPMDEDETRVEPTVNVEDTEPVTCDPIPLKQWIEEEEGPGELCRPCVLPVGMSWYYTELKDKGLSKLAARLNAVKDSGDAVKVAGVMDELKEEAPDDVRARLRDFDCALQVNVQMEADDLEEIQPEAEG